MDNQTGPKGFLVVRPGEIIEIPQDSDRSWLTPFYSLPKELAKKWEPGMKFEQNGLGFQNLYLKKRLAALPPDRR